MSTFKAKIRGVKPGMLMHNNTSLLYPDNEKVVEFTELSRIKTKEKTTEVLERIARIEWELGLYLNEKDEPVIPTRLVEAVINHGARCFKEGKRAAAAVIVPKDTPLIYDGPKGDLDKMYEYRDGGESRYFADRAIVVISRQRVPRTRPHFPEWEAEITGTVSDDIADMKDVEKWLRAGGAQKGLGDRRPQYGRFEVLEFQVVK